MASRRSADKWTKLIQATTVLLFLIFVIVTAYGLNEMFNEIKEITNIQQKLILTFTQSNVQKNEDVVKTEKVVDQLVSKIVFIKYKKLPKNHSERFRILQIKENNIYHKLDQVWSKYTDSYSKPTNNESVNMFKKTIKDIVNKNENFSEEIKKIIE